VGELCRWALEGLARWMFRVRWPWLDMVANLF